MFQLFRFALFLFLVIKKLVSLISANAGLQVSWIFGLNIFILYFSVQAAKEAALKQAESASRAAETLMTAAGDESDDANNVNNLKEALEKAMKEAETAKKDVKSMKSQSESLAKEYDR